MAEATAEKLVNVNKYCDNLGCSSLFGVGEFSSPPENN